MIKIIAFDSPRYQTTCKCQAILEYHLIDVKNEEITNLLKEIETIYFIRCPNCEQIVHVPEP